MESMNDFINEGVKEIIDLFLFEEINEDLRKKVEDLVTEFIKEKGYECNVNVSFLKELMKISITYETVINFFISENKENLKEVNQYLTNGIKYKLS